MSRVSTMGGTGGGIVFRSLTRDGYEQVRHLVIASGWGKRVQDEDRFRRMMAGADRAVVALDGARIVGFARALFDDASNGYISMVAVATDRRGRGLGRGLVGRLVGVEEPRPITSGLRSARGRTGVLGENGVLKSGGAV